MDQGHTRTAALRGYGILNSPNEPAFDALVREAAAALRAPMALISLLDEDRQWFKARVGIAVAETPLAISFCTHAIRGPGVFEVGDATRNPAFSNNPLVTGRPFVRFYAGAPLKTPNGLRIGTLCVLDRTPRGQLSSAQRQRLTGLADRVMAMLEKRRGRGAAVELA